MNTNICFRARFAEALLLLLLPLPLLLAGCSSASPTSTGVPPVDQPPPPTSGADPEAIIRSWLRGEGDLRDHLDPARGIAALTYYREMADPPEAHPATDADGMVRIARVECEPLETLEPRRRLIAGLGPERLECDAAASRCFFPAPDAGGGFTFIFRQGPDGLVLDAFLILDGDYFAEGQRAQDEWVAEHLEELRTSERDCSE